MPKVAYDPNNALQNSFLGALSLSEVGNDPNGLYRGTGGRDLSGAERDEYGFPQWSGIVSNGKPSHAAGFFQFQPRTWESYAKTYDLDFQDAQDQKAAAWYLAQDTYARETGGDLSGALQAGDYASVEAALGKDQWIGARGKLAAFLSGGKTAPLPSGAAGGGEDTSGFDWRRFNPFRNPFKPLDGEPADDGLLPRVALFVVGVLVLLVAAWWLLSSAGVVPSAGSVAKTAVKVAAVAA